MVQSGAVAKALTEFQITNIHGHLSAHGIEEQLPTIVIVTHYDAFGIAPVRLSVVTRCSAIKLLSFLFVNSVDNNQTRLEFYYFHSLKLK